MAVGADRGDSGADVGSAVVDHGETWADGAGERVERPSTQPSSSSAATSRHATVAVFTVMNTTMPVVLIVPAIAGALGILLVGGAIMAGLRLATGTLLTSVAAHWAFNAVILLGLRYQRID